MRLPDARFEFFLTKDHSPASRRWYAYVLDGFLTWAAEQGVPDVESITAPLVRRYIETRRAGFSASSLHGHVRGLRAFLNWAAAEGLLDAQVARRVQLPKREQKVMATLTRQQIERLFLAADISPDAARDTAILAVLLDTALRASELC